ncbi:HAD family hydrolase [Corynebacterium sp.]|jgi:FMN phosphatase YigB (HAD superfamily)|uniref:HAD family hydrolase n=1 Tax=Corynebacterium sp. TaxID=1720 RepID=UPI0025C54010|nr:HAD family hydrolase [Corynebacterium sp.]
MVLNEFSLNARAIVFDVGETLVDETRQWTDQATMAGVPAFTFLALFGSLIERGEDHRKIWDELGIRDPENRPVLLKEDLYPDVLPCISSARSAGLSIGIAGNQPEGAVEQIAAAGVPADFIASSSQWGVEKPSEEFFQKVVDASGIDAGLVLYVGDRLDNDILPARRMGMQTAFLEQGPWGIIHSRRPEVKLADFHLKSLAELAALWG